MDVEGDLLHPGGYMQHPLVGEGILVPTSARLLDRLLRNADRHRVYEGSGQQTDRSSPVVNNREGVGRDLHGWYTLVFRLRTAAAIEIYLQPLAPLHFMDTGHLFRHPQERQCHSTICHFSSVRVRWEMFARNLHHAIPPLVGCGYQGVADSCSLDEVENTEYDRDDNDLRVVITSGCAGHDGIHRLDLWIWEGFRTTFLTDPQCQRECRWRSEGERRISKLVNSFWKKHLCYRVSVRVPITNLGQRPGRTERRERSTDTFRTRHPDTTRSVGG